MNHKSGSGQTSDSTAPKPRTVLVAGGAGFLGSHLCERLRQENCEVFCIDSLITGQLNNLAALRSDSRFHFIEADIVDSLPNSVLARSYDEIYNLACAASPSQYQADPEHTLLTSVMGTHRLLRLAERDSARFLFTSTSEIYGDPLVHPQDEAYLGNVNPIGPRACYDEGKRAAETLCFDYDRGGRVRVRVVRIFNTYGPRLRPEDGRVVSNFVAQALRGQPLTVYGSGQQTRSFCYVDDMVSGILLMARYSGEQPGPVNVGNPNEVTIAELALRVQGLAALGDDVIFLPLPTDDPQRRKPNIDRARRLLGWTPTVSLDDGLKWTFEWFQSEMGKLGASLSRAESPMVPIGDGGVN